MQIPIFVKSYTPPTINVKEVLRYLRVDNATTEIMELVDECVKEIKDKLTFKVCYALLPIKTFDDSVHLTFTTVKSKNLSYSLKNCNKAILFTATVGMEIDRLLAKYNVVSPTKALVFQAIGTERIESLCDLFNEEITNEYKLTKPRFSPGYGDLPIELQTEIFNFLQCQKRIGVAINKSLLMTPSKSVSAFIGIEGDNLN